MLPPPHPVDSTRYPCCNAIGRHGRECKAGLSEVSATMRAMYDDADSLVDVGAATPPPRWCPDAKPDWQTRTDRNGGGQFATWTRSVEELWISCHDEVISGRVLRSQPRIFGTEEPGDGWTAEQARELAGDLITAADLIDGAE